MGRRGSKYCEKCGCYLPEGETACVSCGYDPTAPTYIFSNAVQQALLYDMLWAKGGKGNPSIIRTPKAEKDLPPVIARQKRLKNEYL